MHHHPGIWPSSVNNTVIGEHATVVKHAGIDRATGIDLGHVTRRTIFEHIDRVRANEVYFFETGHVHQPGFGSHRYVFLIDILIISPGRAHPAPVFKLRAQSTVAITQN